VLTKLDLMDKGTNALDVRVCWSLVICGFWRKLETLLPLDSVTISVSFFSFRFLKEELTDCSIPGLALLTARKQILTGMLT
jgi:hypothetical protein